MADFQHVTDWLFDLDNTLYPRSCNLFTQIDKLMTEYVVGLTGLEFADARKLQKDLYREHGTTLRGLMHSYDVDPDDYLRCVHDIDYSNVLPHPELIDLIKALPGRKFVFTNADSGHAEAVLSRLGGSDVFDGMFDIRAAEFQPKPQRVAYEKCLLDFDISPERAAMFDDLEKNLKVPHELGMRTVHIAPSSEAEPDEIDMWQFSTAERDMHVDHVTDDLYGFLDNLQLSAAPC
jgi:putative hydrolase of the HAD superfamily